MPSPPAVKLKGQELLTSLMARFRTLYKVLTAGSPVLNTIITSSLSEVSLPRT